MNIDQPLKIGIIAGEQSGQLLASDLLRALASRWTGTISLVGVGGDALRELGLKSIFNPDEIALTGITSVVRSLPKLLYRVSQAANAIIAEEPDCLLLVDSPEFSLRVAKRVKKALPDLPVIKYVAPSVWAWRPGRAAKMSAYIDHILAILPFEPDVMERLGGPKTHYVGHRLITDEGLNAAWDIHTSGKVKDSKALHIVVLPGSRSGEIDALIGIFGKTVKILHSRGHKLDVTMPTLPRFEKQLRDETSGWPVEVKITIDRAGQIEAYKAAHVALAASGTVTLELALAGVPAMSCYKLDPMMKIASRMITTWTAALPNIIADQPIVREFYNEHVRPELLARSIELLVGEDNSWREGTLNGYAKVRAKMHLDHDPSDTAAKIIIDILEQK